MLVSERQRLTRTLTRQGLCGALTWTQRHLINFFAASVFPRRHPGTSSTWRAHRLPAHVLLGWYHVLSQCRRLLGGTAAKRQNIVWRSEGAVGPTCKVTTCIRFLGHLNYDFLKPAVNQILFPLYSRDAIINMFATSSRSDHTSFAGDGPRLGCGPSGPSFLLL